MTANSAMLCRALRGPVTLMVVGTLFALDHSTRYAFGQTWPVLLIVYGLLCLGCRIPSEAGGNRGGAS